MNKANVAKRESDLKVRRTPARAPEAQLRRGITPRQISKTPRSRYNTTVSQLDGAQSAGRRRRSRSIDELKITLSNTTVVSPVDGFVSRRLLDPGAFAGANTVILSVVDISTVRLVANLVEKDFKRVQPGVARRGPGRRVPGRDVHAAR